MKRREREVIGTTFSDTALLATLAPTAGRPRSCVARLGRDGEAFQKSGVDDGDWRRRHVPVTRGLLVHREEASYHGRGR